MRGLEVRLVPNSGGEAGLPGWCNQGFTGPRAAGEGGNFFLIKI